MMVLYLISVSQIELKKRISWGADVSAIALEWVLFVPIAIQTWSGFLMKNIRVGKNQVATGKACQEKKKNSCQNKSQKESRTV